MDIQLDVFKKLFETSVKTASFNGKKYANGNQAKEALIRSQSIINIVHESVKQDFLNCGIDKSIIYPAVGKSGPEVKIKGFLKPKCQDIVIIPNAVLRPATDSAVENDEKIISINVRSQLSSLAKNIDTLYERTFAEALNLHLNCPKQCLGEVYLIPTHEYDDQAMMQNKIRFKSVSKIGDYIRMFQAINNREDVDRHDHKYERIALLIADFRPANPVVYNSVEELKRDGLVAEDLNVSLVNLTPKNFAEDLLAVYRKRFGTNPV